MKIAVSACLLGEACRYDGQAKECAAVGALAGEHELVPICPEVLGGLPVPRARCELVVGEDAACVVDETGAPGNSDAAGMSCVASESGVLGVSASRALNECAMQGAGICALRVIDETGADKTDAFVTGAQKAWEIASREGCELAVLKSKSPSCGTGLVYDGTFSGTLVPGYGITARLFRKGGMHVIDEEELAQLVAAKEI